MIKWLIMNILSGAQRLIYLLALTFKLNRRVFGLTRAAHGLITGTLMWLRWHLESVSLGHRFMLVRLRFHKWALKNCAKPPPILIPHWSWMWMRMWSEWTHLDPNYMTKKSNLLVHQTIIPVCTVSCLQTHMPINNCFMFLAKGDIYELLCYIAKYTIWNN